jgi:hypothetical protein
MTDQIKDYLLKYNITSEEELATHIEELKRCTKPNNELIFPLVELLVNDSSVLNSFFREIKLDNVKSNAKLQYLGRIDMSKGNVPEQIKECFSNYKTLTPHIRFTILEENTITEKEQEKLSREHIGLSTRHKAHNKMTYLDEAVAKGEEKVFDETSVLHQWNATDDKAFIDWKENSSGTTKNSAVGVKHNKKKLPMSILFTQFPDALKAVVECSEYGHRKYIETDADYLNFKRVEGGSKTYADASIRHRLEPGNDVESGLPHQYHVAWNALAELQLWIEENMLNKS